MSTFLSDTFVDTNATTLASHTPSGSPGVGGAWTLFTSSGTVPYSWTSGTDTLSIDNGLGWTPDGAASYAGFTFGTWAAYYSATTIGNAEYDLTVNLAGPAISGGAARSTHDGALWCLDAATGAHYRADIETGAVGSATLFRLIKRDGSGTDTLLSSQSVTIGNAANEAWTLTINCRSTGQAAKLVTPDYPSGVTLTSSDVALTAPGKAGIFSSGAYSGFSTFTGISGATAGGSPLTAGTVSTTSNTATSVSVSIATNSGGTAPYTNQLQRSPHGAGTWTNVGSSAAGATATLTDGTVSASTAYDFRVQVTDSATPTPATATSNTLNVTTPATGSFNPTTLGRLMGNIGDVAALSSHSACQVASGATAWFALTITGTAATLNVFPNTTTGITISVDGGAFGQPPESPLTAFAWTPITLFTGLSDAAHTVVVKFDALSAIQAEATSLSVTGAAPAVAAPTGYNYYRLSNAVSARSSPGIVVEGSVPVDLNYGQLCLDGLGNFTAFSIRFRATTTTIKAMVVENGAQYALTVDGTTSGTLSTALPTGGAYNIATLFTGLDGGAEHEYILTHANDRAYGYLEGLIVDSLNGTTLAARDAWCYYGNSVSAGLAGTSNNSTLGFAWLLSQAMNKACENKAIGGTYVSNSVGGATAGETRTADVTGASPAPSKIFCWYGFNDIQTSTVGVFSPSYQNMVNELHTGLPGALLYCMSLPWVSDSATRSSFNSAIQSAVTGAASANVVYLDMSPVLAAPYSFDPTSGVDTVDGIHPNAGGYVKIKNFLMAALATATGTAAGSATVSGVGAALATSTGTAAGTSTVSGVGLALAQGTGTAAGSATVSGTGAALSSATGTAAGMATVSGTGAALASATGTAAGVATVRGVAVAPIATPTVILPLTLAATTTLSLTLPVDTP